MGRRGGRIPSQDGTHHRRRPRIPHANLRKIRRHNHGHFRPHRGRSGHSALHQGILRTRIARPRALPRGLRHAGGERGLRRDAREEQSGIVVLRTDSEYARERVRSRGAVHDEHRELRGGLGIRAGVQWPAGAGEGGGGFGDRRRGRYDRGEDRDGAGGAGAQRQWGPRFVAGQGHDGVREGGRRAEALRWGGAPEAVLVEQAPEEGDAGRRTRDDGGKSHFHVLNNGVWMCLCFVLFERQMCTKSRVRSIVASKDCIGLYRCGTTFRHKKDVTAREYYANNRKRYKVVFIA
mmetsp:Transcript_1176/g.2928  ORF Transcript_1176/g.2928 Transcript_1176/m.2928 type:complete len:292 (+) Transcript_1176:143-1018(+)